LKSFDGFFYTIYQIQKRLLERSPVKLINLTNYLKSLYGMKLCNLSVDYTDLTLLKAKELKRLHHQVKFRTG